MSVIRSKPSVVSDRLEAAEAELGRERRRVTDELEALETFENRVRSIGTTTPSPVGHDRAVLGTTASVGSLDRVREAYESTVMSVPHYADEYGDTYRWSLGEEFTPDLAVALTNGESFDERHKRTLLSAIEGSKSARETLLAELGAERESLADATETLLEIAEEIEELSTIPLEKRSFGALDAYHSRLGVLETKCETVSDRRQQAVFEQRRTGWLPTDVADIATYLYQDLDVTYPVMSSVAVLVEGLCDFRLQVERAMSGRRT